MEMAFSNSGFFDDQDDDDFLQNEHFFCDSPRVSVLDTIPEETVEELDLEQVGGGDFITKISDTSLSNVTCTHEWLNDSVAYNNNNNNNNDDKSFLIGKRDLEWRTRVFDDLMASTDGVGIKKTRYRSRSLEDITTGNNNDKGLSFLSVEAPPSFVLLDVTKTANAISARKSRKCSREIFRDDLLNSSDDEDEYSSKNTSLTSRYVCQDLTQIDELERDSPRQPRPSNENLSQDSGFCDVGQPEVNLMDTIGEECERKTNEVEDANKMRGGSKMEVVKTMEASRSWICDSNNAGFEFHEIGDIDDDTSWAGGLLQKEWEKSIQSGRATTDDWLTYGPKVAHQPKISKGWKSVPALSVPEIRFTDEEASKSVESATAKEEVESEAKSLDLRNVFAECRKRVQEGRDRVAKSVSNLSQVERSVRQQLQLQMTSSVKCQSVGYLETDLDTMQSRAVDETNMDQVMGSIKNASKTLSLMTLPRPPRNMEEDKTRSLEFLLNEENRKSVQPPENQLKEDGQKSLSQHELRVRKSLQNLDVPDWLKKSLHTNGFILKRKNGASYLGTFAASKTSSPTSNNTKTCMIPSFCWRYLNSGSNTPTSPSKCDGRQPYLGWRSMEKISLKQANFYQSPPERLSAAPGYYALKYGSYHTDNNQSDCSVNSSDVVITQCVKPRRQRIIWIESSFVGVRNQESTGCDDDPELKDV